MALLLQKYALKYGKWAEKYNIVREELEKIHFSQMDDKLDTGNKWGGLDIYTKSGTSL